jgi:hypothetical protein
VKKLKQLVKSKYMSELTKNISFNLMIGYIITGETYINSQKTIVFLGVS